MRLCLAKLDDHEDGARCHEVLHRDADQWRCLAGHVWFGSGACLKSEPWRPEPLPYHEERGLIPRAISAAARGLLVCWHRAVDCSHCEGSGGVGVSYPTDYGTGIEYDVHSCGYCDGTGLWIGGIRAWLR